MEVSRRYINCRTPHPTRPTEFEVLTMDDGFTSVTPAKSIPEDVDYVDVSGHDTFIAGVRSFGDSVVPSRSRHVDRARHSSRWTLSDCFRGLNVNMHMWGKKSNAAELLARGDAVERDQTKIEMEPGDVLSCVTADPDGRIICFDNLGDEISGWTFRRPVRLHSLKNYYAFCGVLSADRSRFTVHCVWNVQQNSPVGPPFDRRMAQFVGLDFAPTATDWMSCPDPIMLRFDGYMPLIFSK